MIVHRRKHKKWVSSTATYRRRLIFNRKPFCWQAKRLLIINIRVFVLLGFVVRFRMANAAGERFFQFFLYFFYIFHFFLPFCWPHSFLRPILFGFFFHFLFLFQSGKNNPSPLIKTKRTIRKLKVLPRWRLLRWLRQWKPLCQRGCCQNGKRIPHHPESPPQKHQSHRAG